MYGKVCAEYRVVAEPERARERAEEETRRVLDIFRYSIPVLYGNNLRVNVSIMGEMVERTLRWIPIVSSDGKFSHNSSHVIGPITPFELNEINITKMESIGVFILSEILAKSEKDLNNFEETLIRALHWFSSSLTQYEIENQHLNLIICLETILTPRDGNPIGTAIAEGTAILITTGLENRKNLKNELKRQYRLRSGVSHGGKKEILESDVRKLKRIAGMLINIMIEKRAMFQSQKDILGYIESQKLS